MDKYEYSIKIDELKRLTSNGQFKKAYKVLEALDLQKVKNIKELYVVVDILLENEKYEQAKEILIGISRKMKSRRVIHQLVDVSIKLGQVDSTKKYMIEFYKLAPKDPYNQVFQYELSRMLNESYEKQIDILEQLKHYEYMEKWAYELAKVYHRADRDEDCIAECNDLILWFGEGIYVEKAKVLKQYLTGEVTLQAIAEESANKVVHPMFSPYTAKEEDTNSYKNSSAWEHFAKDETEDQHVYSKKETVQIGKRVHEDKKPLYQTAFDFIETMELQEQEEEFDRIINGANEKIGEFDNAEETTNKGELDNEEETTNNEEIANDSEVKQLVEETSNEIANQIGQLFSFELEDEIVSQGEDEVTSTSNHGFLSGLDGFHEITCDDIVVSIASDELLEETSCSQQVYEEEMEQEEVHEVVEQNEANQQQVDYMHRVQMVYDETASHMTKKQELQSKEAVIEDVDKLIKKRHQRVVLKNLKEIVKRFSEVEVDVTEVLGAFTQVTSISEEILKSLENIAIAHNKKITVLLSGADTFDMTYLARRIAKLFYSINLITTQRLVVLDCNKFTDIDFIKHIDQIQGGCVIVENVNTEFEKIRNQVKILHSYDCLVILEVSDVEIEKGLKDLSIDGIKEFIHMCSMEADELMAFAEEYVKEKEYFIEEQAKEFLLNYIEELIRECDSSALCKALEKISKAYHCANERNKVELRHIAESGNFKDAILMSINYKDFACEI